MLRKDTHSSFCPGCLSVTGLDRITGEEDLEFRGEKFRVLTDYFKCRKCGEEFESLKSKVDPLDAVYREYRRRHGMVQPETIAQFRKTLGLTQRELAALLGFGDATLSRYENGALQDDAHDRLLRLIMKPGNLLDQMEHTPDALPAEKRTRIERMLKKASGTVPPARAVSRGKTASPAEARKSSKSPSPSLPKRQRKAA